MEPATNEADTAGGARKKPRPGAGGRRRPRVIGLWVGLGGALGAVARFAIGGWVTTWAHAGFPWATFAVNVLGSAALGFLSRGLPTPLASPAGRAFLTVGFCGAFTTFSTFDYETLALLQEAQYVAAALYALGSVAACIAGIFGGIRIADRLGRRPVEGAGAA